MEQDPSPRPPRRAGRGQSFWLRLLLAAGVVAGVAAFVALDPGRFLTWDSIVARRSRWQAYARDHPIEAPALFAAAYVAVTALSLPGAAVLSLVAGALFGRWAGTLVVSVASTTGAAAAFLATRHLLRDVVMARWGRRLEPINRGVDEGGAYYLLTLRLVPVFPFFLVNAAMGLTRMRLSTFWWASQLGMLPGTFLYVNAGAELGRVAAPSDVLTPPVLVSLTLLGLLPLVGAWVARVRRRRSATDVASRRRAE